MVEIELSTIPDAEIDTQVLAALLADFGNKFGVKVRIHTMTWGTAWTDLITFASHGKGPDLTHIGGTWVSSLAIMNALRPFTPIEIEDMGGVKAYQAPTWQSGMMYGDNRIWSVPWTGYIYVICYRKDLLEQAGIDSTTAFGTSQALSTTVHALKRSQLEIPWLMPYVPPPYSDLVHMAASWIWEAGGDYIDQSGEKIVINKPEALQGLKAFLEVYRGVPEVYSHISMFEGTGLFARGRAAAVIADNRFAASMLAGNADPVVRKNLGVATLTSVPWYGGGSFVIWRHTQGYPDRELAAVQLVKYLTGKEAQIRWAREVRSMPARSEVLKDIYPPESALSLAINSAAQNGRTYHAVPLWRRLEYQIGQALGICWREARENLSADLDTILHNQLDSLAERLNLTLKG